MQSKAKTKPEPEAKPESKQVHVEVRRDVKDSNIVVGDNNTVTIIYHGEKVVIPSAEAVARHRAALGEKLVEDAKARWGKYFIQEEAVNLPIEASPYNTGQLGTRTNLLAALKSAKRMLVLGDPGSGKTVALEQLAQDLCAGAELVIPVIIKLFKYDGKPLADWAWARLRERGELQFKDVTALNAFLQEGAARCVFLFDGLNEVAPEFRNTLAGELDRWTSAYPRHAVIITSRVQDELWRRLREEIPAMVVQTIHRGQARAYLVSYLGKRKGAEIYWRLGERLLALARTPLVLWLIKEAGAAGEDLPGNRGELYARFVTKMLKRDVERRLGIKFTEGAKRRALAALALHLGQAQRLTCTREEAREVMTGALERDASEERAEALLEVCKEHGLLAGEDDKLWFAPHQTVQEYFAAVALQDLVRREKNIVLKLWSTAQEKLTGGKEESLINALAMEDWWMETMVQLSGLVDDPAWLARALAETNPWLAWWCVQEGKGVDDKTRKWIEDRSIKLLGSSQVEDRRRAVQTLTQSRNERVMRPLLQAAGDEDAEISRLAVQGLLDMGEVARAHVEDVLHGVDENLWKCALPYLRTLSDARLWLEIPEKMWSNLLTHEDRQSTVTIISRERNEQFVIPLLKFVGDKNSGISRLAVQGLLDMGEVARAHVEGVLHGVDENLWKCALPYLRTLSDARLWLEIPEKMWCNLLTHEDRQSTVTIISHERNEQFVIPLLKFVGYENVEISGLAVQGLLDMGEVARAHVEDVLHGVDEKLWKCTLPYLRALPDDRLWLEIPEKMRDKLLTTKDRKLFIINAMSHEKNKQFIMPLLQAAGDANEEVSRLAVQGLLDMGETARGRVEDALYGMDENLWKCALPYLRALPNDRLWLAIPEKMWDRLTPGDRDALITVGVRETNLSMFWQLPYGEPEWVTIPAGEFWMGSEKGGDSEKPLHKVTLSEYQIARAPITNAQYALYVQDVGVKKPQHWKDGKIPARLENHPVVYVSWDDAMAYCKWLGEKINKNIILPSEAQWEKAARGSPRLSGKGWGDEVREYPWGDEWKELHCNSEELGLKTTTPVGLFRNGASPYGMLDMSGNTWEWCLDWYDKNEYKVRAGKEIKDPCGMESGTYRVVRGGSWFSNFGLARASYRSANSPDDRDGNYGFRVIVRPLSL